MGNIWSVFAYELKRNIRRKGYLFTTFGIPVLGFLLFMGIQLITGASNPNEQLAELEFDLKGITAAGYVDYSGEFPEPGELATVMTRYPDEASAQAALEAGEIDLYYIIGQDYVKSGKVTVVAPRFAPSLIFNANVPIEQMLYSQWVDQVDMSTLIRLRNPASVEHVQLAEDTGEGAVRNEDTDFVVIYGFSLVFLLAIFSTNGYLMQTVIEEKESRLIEILISSVRPSQLLTGKILALGLLGIVQVSVYLTSLVVLTRVASSSSALVDTFVSGIQIPWGTLPAMLLYFVLGYLFFSAAFGTVGALSTSMSEGPNLAIIFTLPAAVPFYFLAAFINDPNATIPVVLSLIPLTAPLAMIMRLSVGSVPLVQIALSITLLTAAVVGMMWFAGRLFRVHTLLAGRTPRPRDIPRLLRG